LPRFLEVCMARAFPVAEVKMRFADCLREAERGEPVVITRHGKPVAALVAVAELDALRRLRAAGPDAGLAGLAGGWKGSEALVDSIARTPRRRSRRTPRLA
jgi:prevent-host-death family protein